MWHHTYYNELGVAPGITQVISIDIPELTMIIFFITRGTSGSHDGTFVHTAITKREDDANQLRDVQPSSMVLHDAEFSGSVCFRTHYRDIGGGWS